MIWYDTRRFLIDLLCCTGIILMVVYLVIIAPYAILWTRWVAVSSFYSQSHMLDRCRSLKDKFVWTGLSSLKDKFVWTWLRSVGFLIINSFIIGAHTIFISYFFFRFYKYHLCTNVECSFSVLRLWFWTLGSSFYLFIFL